MHIILLFITKELILNNNQYLYKLFIKNANDFMK